MFRAALVIASATGLMACATGDNTPDATPGNFVANGSFDAAPYYWTADGATLTVENGRLRVTTAATPGPGLAYQRVTLAPGGRYRISVTFHEWSFASSPQLRVGRGIDFDGMAQLIDGTTELEFTATDSRTYVTLNNAGPAADDYAIFDDVKLELLFASP